MSETIQVVKCPKCGSEAIWNPRKAKGAKWNSGYECEVCEKIKRVKTRCSHIGAHEDGKKWVCQLCDMIKELHLIPRAPSRETPAVAQLKTGKKLLQLAAQAEKLNLAEILRHECSEECVKQKGDKENSYLWDENTPEICTEILQAKGKIAKWFTEICELGDGKHGTPEITTTPSISWEEAKNRDVWSVRSQWDKEELPSHEKRNSGYDWSYDGCYGIRGSDYFQEEADSEQEYGFLQQEETTIHVKTLNIRFEITSKSSGGFVKLWRTVEANYYDPIEEPLTQAFLDPQAFSMQEVIERAKAIYMDQVAKENQVMTEPEPEELEETGLIDQAKEQLEQEIGAV